MPTAVTSLDVSAVPTCPPVRGKGGLARHGGVPAVGPHGECLVGLVPAVVPHGECLIGGVRQLDLTVSLY